MKWITFPALRRVSDRSKILSDIKSHIGAAEVYQGTDLVTVAHETTHAINSSIRNKYGGNGFYVLDNKAISIQEPKIKLSTVAHNISSALHGMSYDLYVVKQQQYWNDQPLYLLDEWIAYINGTACGLELADSGSDVGLQTSTVKQMLEFNVYALAVAKSAEHIAYGDAAKLRDFITWATARTQELYKTALQFDDFNDDEQRVYLQRFVNSDLKDFADSYLQGAEDTDWGTEEYL